MSDPRTCTRCGALDLTEECPVCTEEWENRRDASDMTPDERLAEYRSWGGILEIDWPKVHQRIEELVGRPVRMHELSTSGIPYLEHEILTGQHPSTEDVLAKIPADKQVIVVEAEYYAALEDATEYLRLACTWIEDTDRHNKMTAAYWRAKEALRHGD